jgi:UDP-glucose 4-epimerase
MRPAAIALWEAYRLAEHYLVTGGAGFIGSHLVAALVARGDQVTVFDNLSTGHRAAIDPRARFIEADLFDPAALDAVFARSAFNGVFHLADLSLVGESMREPTRYLTVNPGNAGRVIDACRQHLVRRLVYASTANLFGAAPIGLIDEDAPIEPGSAYGESKHVVERMLAWAERVHGLRSACLRFFNAAGCDPDGRLGEAHQPETHLIPLAIDAALRRRPPLRLYGADYPTYDGTCVRDYVHVCDLVEAFLLSMRHIERASVRYNVGLGHGYSVREVIEAVGRIAGAPVPLIEDARRPGDPAWLVASPARIMRETGWRPRFASLDSIVETALVWRRNNPYGYESSALRQRKIS